MNDQILALKVAAGVFLLVCLAHILRIIFRLKVSIGNFVIPLWVSYVGALISLLFSLWMIGATK